MTPEYTFEEMIELIRVADREDLQRLEILMLQERKKESYSDYHMTLMQTAWFLKLDMIKKKIKA